MPPALTTFKPHHRRLAKHVNCHLHDRCLLARPSMLLSSSGSLFLHVCCPLCCRTEAREELRNQVGNLRFDLNTVIETSSKSKADKKDAQFKKKEFLAKVGWDATTLSSRNSHGAWRPAFETVQGAAMLLWHLSRLSQLGAGTSPDGNLLFVHADTCPLHCGVSARPALVSKGSLQLAASNCMYRCV